jgi:predicted GNAT superfamily acetyltransferase
MKIMRCPLASLSECLAIARDVSLTADRSLEQGFLLGMPDETEYLRFLHANALWVCQQQEAIVGFVIAYPSTSVLYQGMAQRFAQTTWESRPLVATERLVYIDNVATRPSQRRQGIARALYEHLFSEFADYGFWAGIAEQPWANPGSVTFHVRLGFRRIGTFRTDAFAGLKGYASGIYLRAASQGAPQPSPASGGRASAPGWPKDARASGHGTAMQGPTPPN